MSDDEIMDEVEIEACVKAGMAWLDEHYPDHMERFDAGTFGIWCRCALVQASGMAWHEVMRKHPELDGEYCLRSRELGFIPNAVDALITPSRSIPWPEMREMFKLEEELYNQAWIAAYQSRRNQGE